MESRAKGARPGQVRDLSDDEKFAWARSDANKTTPKQAEDLDGKSAPECTQFNADNGAPKRAILDAAVDNPKCANDWKSRGKPGCKRSSMASNESGHARLLNSIDMST